jgi:hypothetical protein
MPTATEEKPVSVVTMRVIDQPRVSDRTTMLCGNAPYTDIASDDTGRNYTCGDCGRLLIENGRRWHLKPFVFKCRCGACNEIA